MDRRYFIAAPLAPYTVFYLSVALDEEESGDHEMAERWLDKAIQFEEDRKNLYEAMRNVDVRGGRLWRIC